MSKPRNPFPPSPVADACRVAGWLSLVAAAFFVYVGFSTGLSATRAGQGSSGGLALLIGIGSAIIPAVAGVLLLAVAEHLTQQRQMLTALHTLALRAAEPPSADVPVAPDGLPSRAWASSAH